MAEDSPKSGEGNQAVAALQSSTTHDVFVSYASQDTATADAVVVALERAGLSCWIAPRDVVPGSLYADEIVGAINDAKVVVLVLTGHSIASTHVGKEIERASSKKRRIIAFHTDAAPLTRGFEYFLSESQWVDVGSGAMEAAITKLVEAVRRHVVPSAGVESRFHPDAPTVAPKGKVPGAGWVVAGGVAVVVLAIAYFAVEKTWLPRRIAEEKPVAAALPAAVPAAPAVPDKSIAVLPFVDMSEKHDQEYFSDGLSEELIDMLTRVQDLRVPARTSSFYFKGKQATIADIAKALGVAHVLEGSVRKAGNRLRITVQLVRVDNGYHEWSETYDRKLDDIFATQDEIASAVVKALRISLSGTGLRISTTQNSEAFNLYLRAREISRHYVTRADAGTAADYLRIAVAKDPTFALAWALLASVLVDEVLWDERYSDHEVVSELRRAAERALALDPELADVQSMKASIMTFIDWNWEGAAVSRKKAYSANPMDPFSCLGLAGALFRLGGDDSTAIELVRKAISLDPLNENSYLSLADKYLYLGRLSEAETATRKVSSLNPLAPLFHRELGDILIELGKPAEALAEYQRDSVPENRRRGAAIAYHALGRMADASTALAALERNDASGLAYSIALVHARRGEIDQAFAWLDRAYLQHDSYLPLVHRDPWFKNLHSDPRWKAFLRKMNLPEIAPL
jgi:adenylate cyclase